MASSVVLLAVLSVMGAGAKPFAIRVVDEETGRGVPLVELRTVNEIRQWTDSAGVAAVDEPGLMGRSVYFQVSSHGYEYPKDAFGFRGKAIDLVEGGSATLKVKRVNVAERIYRVTGGGIYRDTILLGEKAPVREPLLNGMVLGQDSVLMTRYRGKLQWFWGDTNRPGYPLGNFHSPGATSAAPEDGGLDPEVGVDLTYYLDEKGFARGTAKMPGEGPTWIAGLSAFRDEEGKEQLVAGYSKIRPPMENYEHGLVVFDPETNEFRKGATFALDSAIRPLGHTFKGKEGGVEYIYYSTPLPLTRVRARLGDLKDIRRYEGFTCLETGTRVEEGKLDRGADGALRYAWRANTPPMGPGEQAKLIKEGKIKAEEGLLALRDVETGKPIGIHYGSTYWNKFRGRWVMIAVEAGGSSSYLGEVWWAEGDTPLGPWVYARKIVTHDKYSFYNPKYHPEFDKEGGRVIFFEGTYTTTFSRQGDATPRYDYNQVMYKLDLADARLNLPVAVYRLEDGSDGTGAEAMKKAKGAAPVFFAKEREGPGLVGWPEEGKARFYVVSGEAQGGQVPLWMGEDGLLKVGENGKGRRVGMVWPAPTRVRLPVWDGG